MITIRRAEERYEAVQPGIVSRHCFSAGPHYDPGNLGFGALIACDEHTVEPGAGFAGHAHRDVELVSWVLEGTLRHEDDHGRVALVRPGVLQYQAAGRGIRHAETNASTSDPLRFVQLWLRTDGVRSDAMGLEPRYGVCPPPLAAIAGEVTVLHPGRPTVLAVPGWAHLYLTRGRVKVDGVAREPGDSVRILSQTVTLAGFGEGDRNGDGDGEVLVVSPPEPQGRKVAG